jgi:hypothetical protein
MDKSFYTLNRISLLVRLFSKEPTSAMSFLADIEDELWPKLMLNSDLQMWKQMQQAQGNSYCSAYQNTYPELLGVLGLTKNNSFGKI